MPSRLRFLPIAAVLVALALTAVIAGFVHASHKRRIADTMQAAAERIEHRVGNYVLALKAIRGAFAASRQVPPRQFLVDMLRVLPSRNGVAGAQGFGFAMATPVADPSEAMARLRRDYGIERAPFPATDQPVRYPIVMLEPADARNLRALGFDMYQEPQRRMAMQNAARTGLAAATGPIALVQDGQGEDQQRGFLIYVALFNRDGVDVAGAPAQDAAGFLYAPVRMNDLIEQVLAEEPAISVAIEAFSESPEERNLLYRSPVPPTDAVVVPIQAADRRWILRVGEAEARRGLSPAVFVGLIGLVLAGAVGALADAHMRSVDATRRLADEMKAHADQRELMLGEMQHRIKNSIARIGALFRLTTRETAARDDLVSLFEGRLQAMARAQAVVASAPGSHPIKDVIGAEIRQWSTAGTDLALGPDVRLGPLQVQGVSMILHELATNSMKYGALAAGNRVAVSWRRVPGTEPEEIALVWRESLVGAPEAPSAPSSGSGLNFIRMMAQGQLGGRVERTLTEDGLEVVIAFPERMAEAEVADEA